MTRLWLIVEALALSLPATLLLAAGLPIAARSTELFAALSGDFSGIFESLLALLPYLCGLFAWVTVWWYVLMVAAGQHLELGMWFWTAGAAGFATTCDVLVVQPKLVFLACAPVWILVAHLLLLGVRPQSQRGPELA